MKTYKDCPLCSQRMIHVSVDACEQCEWAASFARDVDKAHKELEQVKAERNEAIRERDLARMLLGEVLAVLNGDGGQAVVEHGRAEATNRGLERYLQRCGNEARLRECLETIHYSFKMGNVVSGPMLQTWAEFIEKVLNEESK